MKLLQKTTRINIFFSILVMVTAAVVLFIVLQTVMNDEIDEMLAERIAMVTRQLENGRSVQAADVKVEYGVSKSANLSELHFSDSFLYNQKEGENEPYRKAILVKNINGDWVKITVVASRLEWEDFFAVIFWVFLIMALLLIVSTIVINNLVAQKLWQPFYHDLAEIKNFSVRSNYVSALKSSGIREFDELKEAMEKLQFRVKNEYETLKEFSENAAHEFQTPVAVIRAKLDRLSQHTALDREMAEIIDSAQLSVNRLSRLNKNLLLIAKLGNGQFNKEDELDITDILEKQLLQTSDLFKAKEIRQILTLEPDVRKQGNEALCEILISNLLSNALHYTPAKGVVKISLSFNELLVSNSGSPLSFTATDLFRRFKKGENGNGANGLGLSIAKDIADFLQWGLSYIYQEQQHIFKIKM